MRGMLLPVLFCMGAAAHAQAPSSNTDLTTIVAKLKTELTRNFKDPSSVLYRGTFLSETGFGYVLCGEVNGKNSYGAYVGFRKFFIAASAAEVVPGMMEIATAKSSGVVDAMWPSVCGKRIADVQP